MKSNGNGYDPHGRVLRAEAMVDAILDAEVEPPIKVDQNFKRSENKNGKAMDFYKSVRWDEWWDEFCTATLPNGRLKYKTAWSFAKAKVKKESQRQLIYEMIGPAPETPKEHWRVPWLGDWQKRRANGFWALDDPAKVAGIKKALKERQDALEAALAIAPLSVQQIQRWIRLTEKIDEAFNGEPFLKEFSANHPKNEARFKAYMQMHTAAARQLRAASEMYLSLHGLNPSEPDKWLATAALAAGAGAYMGAKAGSNQLPISPLAGNLPSPSDIQLARAMRDKAQLYGTPLPDVIQPETKTKQ